MVMTTTAAGTITTMITIITTIPPLPTIPPSPTPPRRAKDPLTFLYYSIVLTALTVLVASIIGTIQLLTLIQHVARPHSATRFWSGVSAATDHYDVIGGAICGSFVVVGGLSVVLFRPWRRWVEKGRRTRRREDERGEGGGEEGVGMTRDSCHVVM